MLTVFAAVVPAVTFGWGAYCAATGRSVFSAVAGAIVIDLVYLIACLAIGAI